MRFKKLAAAFLAANLVLLSGCTLPDPSMFEPQDETEETVNMADLVIRAEDDFYGYINKDVLLGTEIEYGYMSAGSFNEAAKTVNDTLEAELKRIVESEEEFPEGSSEAEFKLAYEQYLEFYNSESLKTKAGDDVESLVKKIMDVSSLDELMKLNTELQRNYGTGIVPISVGIDYNAPDCYCICFYQIPSIAGADFSDVNENNAYASYAEDYAKAALCASGVEADEAKAIAKKFAYEIIEMAWATDCEVENAVDFFSTVYFVDSATIDSSFVNKSTSDYEKYAGIKSNPYGGWCVQDEKQLAAFDKLFEEDNLDVLKTWMLTEFLMDYGEYIVDRHSELKPYFGKVLDSLSEEDALKAVILYCGDYTGDIYAKAVYTEAMDEGIRELCDAVKEGYRNKISSASWLSDEGRKLLLEKLENIDIITGKEALENYASKEPDEFGKNWYESLLIGNRKFFDEMISFIGTERDKLIPGMGMDVVNACYSPDNTVTITVAIMSAPFFDVDRDFYTNLGGLGSVIAHEIGHAFDSNGMNWDMNGYRNPDWLPKSDVDALAAKNIVAAEYFETEFKVFDVYHVDGMKTLGENYADLGGMECIMTICETNEQRKAVFEQYAVIWRELSVENNVIEQINTDEHSPAVIRVNAVVATIPEFYSVYGVKDGDGMFVAPENRISRW